LLREASRSSLARAYHRRDNGCRACETSACVPQLDRGRSQERTTGTLVVESAFEPRTEEWHECRRESNDARRRRRARPATAHRRVMRHRTQTTRVIRGASVRSAELTQSAERQVAQQRQPEQPAWGVAEIGAHLGPSESEVRDTLDRLVALNLVSALGPSGGIRAVQHRLGLIAPLAKTEANRQSASARPRRPGQRYCPGQ